MDAQIALTREQVRRVDRLAVEQLGMPSIVLMENAGRNAATVVASRIGESLCNARVIIFAGPGNNGGDGFVIARHLINAGHHVGVHLVGDPSRLSRDAAINHHILCAMGVDIGVIESCDENAALPDAAKPQVNDIVVDALLGTGATGNPRSPMTGVIRAINESTRRLTVAVDVPSGLDCDTGLPGDPTIRADVTITFVAPKVGFGQAGASAFTGQVIVADIGAPPSLIDDVRR